MLLHNLTQTVTVSFRRLLRCVKGSSIALFALVLFFPISANAGDCADTLRELEGWTIVSVTQVDGEWEGCDFGRVIKFTDGSTLKCASYSYSYAYRPDAIVFGKRAEIGGRSFISMKVLVEDELYDLQPIISRP